MTARVDPASARIWRPASARIWRIALALAFALSLKQLPLYSSNQNSYFVHGLARAGLGWLRHDWIARTADPFPLFSFLVSATVAGIGDRFFYLYHFLLQWLYAYSLIQIITWVFPAEDTPGGSLALVVPTALLHYGFKHTEVFVEGVAGQYILGPYLQPSGFGVFLLASIAAFLRGRFAWASLCLVVAAAFHPTYLLSAAALTAAYMGAIASRDRSGWKAGAMGLGVLLLLAPFLVHTVTQFHPSSPDIAARAEAILVDYRLPHHAVVASWWGGSVVAQILVVAAAIVLVRQTRLFSILLVLTLTAVALTVVQVAAGSRSLALMFPWRLSVLLVPLASTLLVAWVGSECWRQAKRRFPSLVGPLTGLLVLVLAGLAGVGLVRTARLLQEPRVGRTALADYASRTSHEGDLYLVPTELETFRIAAGVPVLVDLKTHPYRDREVLEWFERLRLVEGFYNSTGVEACRRLASLAARYGITRVVGPPGFTLVGCPESRQLFRDPGGVIYELPRGEPR